MNMNRTIFSVAMWIAIVGCDGNPDSEKQHTLAPSCPSCGYLSPNDPNRPLYEENACSDGAYMLEHYNEVPNAYPDSSELPEGSCALANSPTAVTGPASASSQAQPKGIFPGCEYHDFCKDFLETNPQDGTRQRCEERASCYYLICVCKWWIPAPLKAACGISYCERTFECAARYPSPT